MSKSTVALGTNSRHVAEFATDEGKQDRLLYGEGGFSLPAPGLTRKIADAFLRSIEGLSFACDDDVVDSLFLCALVGLDRGQPLAVG